MTDAQREAKTPSPRTGFLATLVNLLHAKGTAAPSYRPAISAGPDQAQSPPAGDFERPGRLPRTRLRHLRRHFALSAAGVLAVGASALLLAAPAQANFEQVGTWGPFFSNGHSVHAIAVNDAVAGPYAGDVYAVGEGDPEVRRYGPKGEFLESWGYGVVRSGPDVAGAPTEAQFTVKATGGTFALNLGHVEGAGPGAPVPFNATHEEVQAALLNLLQGRDPNFASTAEVTVSGGPGDGAGSNPYSVTFGGSLRGRPIQLIIEASGLTGPGASAEITAQTSAAFVFETCFPANGDVCERAANDSEVAPAPDRLGGEQTGVAVDQLTGNVYVRNNVNASPGETQPIIQEFSPDGSQLIAAFGEAGEGDEAGEKINFRSRGLGPGLALDEAGNVYVAEPSRVMVFKPKVPGVYTEYEYAAGHDIAAGFHPGALAVDAVGDVYFTKNLGTTVEKFTLADPDHPAWSSAEESNQGIQGLAVDPASGEAYYYNEKTRRFHQLDPAGKEIATFKGLPTQTNTFALAFDPNFSFEAERAAGTLYAVDNSSSGPPTGYIYAHAVVHPPSVDATSVSAVGTSSAALGAQIDPHGFDTTYRFQYLTQAEFEANGGSFEGEHVAALAPLIPADLGSANADVSANATVSGLTPDTAYRFRVLASSEEGEATGPDLPFHTFAPSAGLLDHRAYELVSPPQKDGGEVFPANPGKGCGEFCKPGTYYGNAPMQAAPDGESVVYEGFPFCAKPGEAPICAPGIGAITENSYLSTRSEGGWHTTDLSPELATKSVGSNGYKAFSTDLSRALLTQRSPSLSPLAPPGYPNLYSHPTAGPPSPPPLLASPPPHRPCSPPRPPAAAPLNSRTPTPAPPPTSPASSSPPTTPSPKRCPASPPSPCPANPTSTNPTKGSSASSASPPATPPPPPTPPSRGSQPMAPTSSSKPPGTSTPASMAIRPSKSKTPATSSPAPPTAPKSCSMTAASMTSAKKNAKPTSARAKAASRASPAPPPTSPRSTSSTPLCCPAPAKTNATKKPRLARTISTPGIGANSPSSPPSPPPTPATGPLPPLHAAPRPAPGGATWPSPRAPPSVAMKTPASSSSSSTTPRPSALPAPPATPPSPAPSAPPACR